MRGLKDTLQAYMPGGRGSMGPPEVEPEITFNRDGLRQDLAELSKRNETYFRACAGMVAVLFVGGIAIVIAFIHDPDYIVAIFGAIGVSVFGIVKLMIKLVTDKKSADVAIAMLGNLDSNISLTVLRLMMERI